MLEAINLFSYKSFFRVKGKTQVNHSCGGLASLILLGVIGVVFMMKLIEAWQMTTVFYTSETVMKAEAPRATISTFPTNSSNQQYMIGFYSGSEGVPKYRVFYNLLQLDERSQPMTTQIKELETCTQKHFSQLDLTGQSGLSDWSCLPLNQTFSISGANFISKDYEALYFYIYAVNESQPTGTIIAYQTNTLINPSSKDRPFEYFIKLLSFVVSNQNTYVYHHTLDLNILETDKTILPGQKIEEERSVSSNGIETMNIEAAGLYPSTMIEISRSSATTRVKRRYLKLLDVLAEIGGLFASLSAVFFFIDAFGGYFFDISFSMRYFRGLSSQKKNFLNFLTHSIFSILKGTILEPKWQLAQKQDHIRNTVGAFLDIENLYNRIHYLEQAMATALQPHHLRTIHLLPKKTIQQADSDLGRLQIRKRLIKMLKFRLKDRKQMKKGPEQEKVESTSDLIRRREGHGHTDSRQGDNFIEEILEAMQGEPDSNHDKECHLRAQIEIQTESIEEEEVQEGDLLSIEQLQQIERDLRLLKEEAFGSKPNSASSRIFNGLDSWIRQAVAKPPQKAILEIEFIKYAGQE